MPDERGWDVKLGNSLGGAPQEGARHEVRTSMDGCEAWKQLVKRGNSLRGTPQEGARHECRTSVDGM